MTAERNRPPILLIRNEGHFGGRIEMHLLDPGGGTRLVADYENLRPSDDLEKFVQEVAATGADFQDVIVDLGQVQWLNSTGLGWLVGLVRHRKQVGHTVALAGANDRIKSLLHITSLDIALPVHATVEDAVRALRANADAADGP